MKGRISRIAAALLALICFAPAALAENTGDGAGQACVTMGADLTNAQRAAVYADFGIPEGSVRELTVTNAEEREYLEGLVPDRKIGSVALSCIYIQTLPAGEGLSIEIHNINYCTEAMYRSALTTAGITDARVIVSAPFSVSGTGALTGAYKAYEDATGVTLSDLAKSLGAEELVLTGELAEYIGSEQAVEIIAEIKAMLDRTAEMSDQEVRSEMDGIARSYGVELSDAQRSQLLRLVRRFEGLSTEELQNRLVGLADTARKAGSAMQTVTRVYESVASFFESCGAYLKGLFR